jgi:hypothetical protein
MCHREILPSSVSWLTSSVIQCFKYDVLTTIDEVRCLLLRERNTWLYLGDQICSAYFLPEDETDMQLISIVLSITFVLTLCGSMRVLNYFYHAAVILWTIDWLGRCLNYLVISDKIDFITVYFVVWQLISVPWTWMWDGLPSPILSIKQASLCIFMSTLAFVLHDYAFRYVPRELSLALLWIISVGDT